MKTVTKSEPLFNHKTGEITGGFKPPFARRGDYPKFYITDKTGKPIAFSDDLNDARNLAAVLHEYCKMKQAQHERSEG